jgi:hypothetical protein
MKYMHFAGMDRQSTSWQRADPEAALIETADTAQWKVTLPDGNDVHTVTLFTDGINTRGHCCCDGYHFHDRCTHLITIRQAQLLDVLTVDGDLVRIPTLADEAVDAVERKVATYDEIEADAEPEAVRPDGGRIETRWSNHCPRCDTLHERAYGPGRYRTVDRCPDCNWPFNVVDPEVVEMTEAVPDNDRAEGDNCR